MRIAVTALAIGLAAVASGASAQQITGAGATFPAPVYTKWGEAAKAAVGIELNYQAIGSGGGQNQILNRTVDFGASDAPMDPAKLTEGRLLQFPTVMGAVVVIVNLPDIKPNEIKLTGEILADIFAGTITKWNDPKLVELNHGVKLPSLAIAPVHRADGSGTTYVFTSYLSAVSPEWKSKVGANTSVNWPAGAGAKGNDGVAATTHNTRGGIGYVENAYATQNKLVTTQLRNKAGQFVEPTMAAYSAAAANGDWAKREELRGEPDRPAGREELADRLHHLHRTAEGSEGRCPQCRRAEVLRLGLQERRQHRQRPGVHSAARPGEGRGSRRLARRGEGTGRQAPHVDRASPHAGTRINRLQQAIASTAIAAPRRKLQVGDIVFEFFARFAGAFVLVLLGAIIVVLFLGGFAAFRQFGPAFLVSADWDPVKEVFGAAVPIYGTIVTSILALLLAVPIAFGIAFYLTELAPSWVRRPVGTAVELLAAVPSIIYGMWGFFVIAPVMAEYIQPVFIDSFDGIPILEDLFAGPPFGTGILTASIILAVMVIPFIAATMRDVFETVPPVFKESAYGVGCTTWEVMRSIVIPYTRVSVVGGIMLGLGRALGETMAVTFVIGNTNRISTSLFGPGNTIASIVALEFPESPAGSLKLSSLLALGFILFVISFIVLAISRLLLRPRLKV